MKNYLYILLCFIVFAVPAFAGPAPSSDSIPLDGNFQTSYKPIKDFQEIDLSDNTFFINTDIAGLTGTELYAQKEQDILEEEEDLDYLEEEEETEIEVSDPLEPINRAFFQFNDKMYFFVLKPVAKGYSTIIPEEIRISVRNFFKNLTTPVRFVNCLLQFKMKAAGTELVRLGINSTVGMLGLYDVARDDLGIKTQDEDFGQTLGVWGAGPGFYITWPLLGPSNVRDSIGSAGDYFLDPVNYVNPLLDSYAIKAGDVVNKTSLVIGDYEEIKKDAIDPYAAFRDIYYQYRESKIER